MTSMKTLPLLLLLLTACASIADVGTSLRGLMNEVELPAELESDVDVLSVSHRAMLRHPLEFPPFAVRNYNPGSEVTKHSGADVQLLPVLALKYDRRLTRRHFTFDLVDDRQRSWSCDCMWKGATDEGASGDSASTSLECEFRNEAGATWSLEFRDRLTYGPHTTIVAEGRVTGPDADYRVQYLYAPRSAAVAIDIAGGYVVSAERRPIAGAQMHLDGMVTRITMKSGLADCERSAIAAAFAALTLGKPVYQMTE